MDAETMKYEFQVRNNLLPGLDSPDLEDEEINMFLNSAQIKVVENLFSKGLTELLTELYENKTLSNSADYSGGINNAKYWDYDGILNYMFFVNGSVEIKKDFTTETVRCTLIDKKNALEFAENSRNSKIWFEYPKIFIDNKKLVVILDSFTEFPTTSNLNISFIKKPSLIDVRDASLVDCELKEVLHIDIVETAVKLVTSTYKLTRNTEDSER